MLTRYKIPISGKRAVVVGRSNIVGLPASMLLQNLDATVTVVPSRTPTGAEICAGEPPSDSAPLFERGTAPPSSPGSASITSHTPTCALTLYAEADIVIAACGKAEMVTGAWIKPGAVVIDVGINAVTDPSAKKGYRLVGDVKYDEVAAKASYISPVPGGVGPMTIAMLLRNTLEGAKASLARRG